MRMLDLDMNPLHDHGCRHLLQVQHGNVLCAVEFVAWLTLMNWWDSGTEWRDEHTA